MRTSSSWTSRAIPRNRYERQTAVVRQLNGIVAGSEQFQSAQAQQQLITLATAGGMALAFIGVRNAPCGVRLDLLEPSRRAPDLPLRLGLHSSAVFRVKDFGGSENISGDGINCAQRVMDCANAGHILVSSSIAEIF